MEISLEPAQKQPQTVHLLPCQIDHNGPAQVSTYFVQTDGVDPLNGGPCKIAAFRGRQLFGVTNRLPSELKGHVYSERRHSDDMEDETTANHDCIEIFDEFTVWKHDHAPDTKSDPFFVAMEWNNIATHLHSTIPVLN
ncbi:ribonuclease H2, subunit C [Umbelopsis sp. AD052]|nr:ribonuclease H2, subunit C [Umbelopsis sp. AD052]